MRSPTATRNRQNSIEITKNEDLEAEQVLMKPSTQTISCPKCNYQGNMNKQYKLGCVSWTWFSCLLLTTLILSPIVFFV